MGVAEILLHIDREIAQLQRARALLNGGAVKSSSKAVTGTAKKDKKKRILTPEGRKRIADAVRRRWAKQRKAAGGN